VVDFVNMAFFHRYRMHSYLLMACAFGGVLMWSLAVLHSEWRAGYVVLYQPTNPVNLIKYHAVGVYERLFSPYIASTKSGLPVRRIYLPQQGLLKLGKRLPENIKNWQRGFALFPDDNLHKVKMRFRGDNPFNWAYEKKSWRMKTRKTDLLEGKRIFNFVRPREASNLNLYLGHFIASETGILASDVRLIELFINDRNQGVFIEMPNLDETFLRAHGIMPVNLYKGEQENQERHYGSEPFLFNNPALWKKLSVFNQIPKKDRSDLKNLFDVAQKSQASDEAFNRLKKIAPLNEWARFSAYQTLTQSWHNSSYHNQRLVADPWRGVIFPVSHDTGVNFHINKKDFKLDAAEHIVSRTFYNSSFFLLQKYQFILDFIDQGLFDKIIYKIDEISPKLIESYERDPSRLRTVMLAGLPVSEGYVKTHRKLVASMRSSILTFEKWIVNTLTGTPNASWIAGDKDFSIIVEGTRPVANIQLVEISSELPSRIAWDRDGNGVLSENDVDLPFRLTDKGIEITATFVANRIHQFAPPITTRSDMITVPTRFRILSDKPLKPKVVIIENPLDGQRGIALKKIKSGAMTPIYLNQPVFKKKLPVPLKLSGRIQINDDRVFSVPVNISAGTILEMAKGASIVFKAGVKMEGKPNSPVVFHPAIKKDVWGAVAISSESSAYSQLKNVIMKGGSGASIGGQRFTAMLSIHDTSDVLLENVNLQDSHFFDDMLHIVYSKNVKIQNSHFQNAYSDAIDIDMSTVHIDGVTIKNSKNDAIDLMSSSVLVENAQIIGSGDKGLSVGEASIVLLLNSLIKNNSIGIESKDRSIAAIHKSSLIDNNTNLNAYYKNWRYGSGGKILADAVFLSPSEKPISADKRSSIEIHNIWSSKNLDTKGDVKLNGFKIAANRIENAEHRLAIIDEILAAWSAGNPEQILP
jgi:hypothetical protein